MISIDFKFKITTHEYPASSILLPCFIVSVYYFFDSEKSESYYYNSNTFNKNINKSNV